MSVFVSARNAGRPSAAKESVSTFIFFAGEIMIFIFYPISALLLALKSSNTFHAQGKLCTTRIYTSSSSPSICAGFCSAFTLPKAFTIMPSSSIKYVVRTTPMLTLP